MVTVGLKCEGFRVEMIIRSILTGSAWREYQKGCREICGVKLPDGMKENQRFPEPIITPTTKADEGHDMNISKEEIIAQGIVSKEDYEVMEDYTRKIFARGQEIAAEHGLILVDTKYEFGKETVKFILLTKYILQTAAAISMQTVMKRNLRKVSRNANCLKNLYVNGLLNTTS